MLQAANSVLSRAASRRRSGNARPGRKAVDARKRAGGTCVIAPGNGIGAGMAATDARRVGHRVAHNVEGIS